MPIRDRSLDQFLCFAVYAAGHAFNRAYKPLLRALALTYPQYLVMVLLWERDGRTVGRIGDRLFLETSTLTPLLKRLEAAGHVTRTRDAADQRQVRVFLTAQGSSLRERARAVPERIVQASGQSIETLERLKREIDALRAALEGAPAS